MAATAALVVALATATSVGAVTIGTPPTLATQTVNAGAGDQTDPHISGSLVSYTTSDVDGGLRIRSHELTTGMDTVVPNAVSDFLSDVNGTAIVFTRIDSSSSIYLYDTATGGAPVELAPSFSVNRRAPAIGGPTVAWQDFGFHASMLTPEIVLYDRPTGVATRLTNDALLDRMVAVSPDGSIVVWTKCQTNGTGCDIWRAVKSGGSWSSSAITGTSGEENAPDTDGQRIVYASTRSGETDVYWQPVAGGAEQQLALAGVQSNPNVSGPVATFDSSDASGNSDVYAYHFASDTAWRLTGSTAHETLNDVSTTAGGLVRVVYQSNATEDFNIYAVSFLVPLVGGPATITLSPATATNSVETSHIVTATVADGSSNAVPDVIVRFSVTGSVTTSGSCTTDASGQCSFTYAGPSLPGADMISAFADTDGDSVQDASEPVAEPATKAWVLPASSAGQASGGGHIEDASGKIAFGFSAKSEDGTLKGQCNVIDPGNRMIKCLDVTALVISGTQATIYGNATDNGVATTYVMKVADNADPGKGADTFSIATASGYSANGTLTAGNIQVKP